MYKSFRFFNQYRVLKALVFKELKAQNIWQKHQNTCLLFRDGDSQL